MTSRTVRPRGGRRIENPHYSSSPGSATATHSRRPTKTNRRTRRPTSEGMPDRAGTPTAARRRGPPPATSAWPTAGGPRLAAGRARRTPRRSMPPPRHVGQPVGAIRRSVPITGEGIDPVGHEHRVRPALAGVPNPLQHVRQQGVVGPPAVGAFGIERDHRPRAADTPADHPGRLGVLGADDAGQVADGEYARHQYPPSRPRPAERECRADVQLRALATVGDQPVISPSRRYRAASSVASAPETPNSGARTSTPRGRVSCRTSTTTRGDSCTWNVRPAIGTHDAERNESRSRTAGRHDSLMKCDHGSRNDRMRQLFPTQC